MIKRNIIFLIAVVSVIAFIYYGNFPSMLRTIIIYGLLVCLLFYFLYLNHRIKKEKKREKANNSILSFNKKINNILAKLNDPQEKLNALNMTLESLESHEEYNKNLAWKYSLMISVYQQMSNIYGKLGDEQELMNVFGRILELNPRHAMTYYNRGTIYSNRGDYGKAIEDLNKAAKYDSSYAKTFNNRGLVYDKIGEYKKAVDEYSHSLILHNSAITHYNRANAYRSLKKYREAVSDYKEYLELDPYNQFLLKPEAENSIKELQEII